MLLLMVPQRPLLITSYEAQPLTSAFPQHQAQLLETLN